MRGTTPTKTASFMLHNMDRVPQKGAAGSDGSEPDMPCPPSWHWACFDALDIVIITPSEEDAYGPGSKVAI